MLLVLLNVVAVVVLLAAVLAPFIIAPRRPSTTEVQIGPWTGGSPPFSTLGFDCELYEPLLPRHHVEVPRFTIVTEQRPPRA